MKKILTILSLTLLLMGCVWAEESVEIDKISFEIPDRYSGGELDDDKYEMENIFSIESVDDYLPRAIGLWACEKDFSEDLTIGHHPVRHFCQYNKYVNGNHSHAFFASNDKIYKISWVGKEIPSDIRKMIKNTPESKIEDETFYSKLDESVGIYKQQRNEQLKRDSEYNYLEAKYNSKLNEDSDDNIELNRILISYYLN